MAYGRIPRDIPFFVNDFDTVASMINQVRWRFNFAPETVMHLTNKGNHSFDPASLAAALPELRSCNPNLLCTVEHCGHTLHLVVRFVINPVC